MLLCDVQLPETSEMRIIKKQQLHYNLKSDLFSLQGFATRFVLTRVLENGGRFEQQDIEQLKRLGGWCEKSTVVHLYIKRIIELYSDTAGLIVPGTVSSTYTW